MTTLVDFNNTLLKYTTNSLNLPLVAFTVHLQLPTYPAMCDYNDP